MWPFKHKHKWETTHVNKWQHAMRQRCKCGEVRRFQWKADADKIIGMPWDKGEWVDSTGKVYRYDVIGSS